MIFITFMLYYFLYTLHVEMNAHLFIIATPTIYYYIHLIVLMNSYVCRFNS